ncbi:secretion protein HlyD [Alcanivorax nanhaiticus]|uniref:Secretion protein HlyD n=1 Tax=Alcanivorax nanhaiticus TaxID=1177154 RepID=A0A095URU1_9GAMM|nr:efflux RND transporter periplasmic adaptor subunit [Alcanivorax nanhaiticus]KGD65235.1 secretion protein HlyD [Alcanivorax nanhaiticus]
MESLNGETASGAGMMWGLVVMLAAVVFLAGCDARSEAEGHMPAPEVDVAEVLEEPVTLWESFTGRVVAPETVELRPRVSGYIDKVAFDEGELVEAGDLLFQIDPRPYEARLQAAKAQLAQARSQLALAQSRAERATSLLESRAISREEYDQRNAELLSAKALVNAADAERYTAQLDLQYTRVTAPVSGRTGRAMVTRGNLASANQTLLTTVVSVDPMHVYFDADEQAAMDSQQVLAEGKSPLVRIGLAGETGFPHQGKLDFIDNRLNASTGTLQYRAELANPDGIFKPGQFARVQLPVADLETAVLVSRKAVLTDQDRRFVYVVNQDNVAARRQVTPGRSVDDLLVIRDGLNSGDRVIINGVQKVFFDGMPVQPQQVAMKDQDAAPVMQTPSEVAAVQP